MRRSSAVYNAFALKRLALGRKTGGPLGTLSVFPAEIRNLIYRYVLDFDNFKHGCKCQSDGTLCELGRHTGKFNILSIFRASKVLYKETYPIMLSSNRFHMRLYHRYIEFAALGRYWATTGDRAYASTNNLLHMPEVTILDIYTSIAKDIPKRLKPNLKLVKHWEITLSSHFGHLLPANSEKCKKTIVDCDLFIQFYNEIKEDTKQRDLHITLQISAEDSEGEFCDLRDETTSDVPNYVINQILTLRNISHVTIELHNKSRRKSLHKPKIELSPEFAKYMSRTLALPKDTAVEPFEGGRYLFSVEQGPENNPDPFTGGFRPRHDLLGGRGWMVFLN